MRTLVILILLIVLISPGSANSDISADVNALETYLDRGYFELTATEAPVLLERVEAEKGKDHRLTGLVRKYWGLAEVQLGRPKPANRILRKARKTLEKSGDYRDVLDIQIAMGEARARMGRSRDAVNAYEAAVSDAKRLFGSRTAEHAEMLVMLGNLITRFRYGSPNSERRAFAKARSYTRRALSIREEVFGSEDPIVADTHRILVDYYYQQEDWKDGIEHAQIAIGIYESANVQDYPAASTMRQFLASGFEMMGDVTAALEATAVDYPNFDADPESVIVEIPRCSANATRDSSAILRFSVEKNGRLSGVTIVEAQPETFGQSAMELARNTWRYRPRFISGVPVASAGVTYEAKCIVDRDNLKARQRAIGRAPTGTR